MTFYRGQSEEGCEPKYVCFDAWYSSLDNLKKIKKLGWNWFTQLKSNRQIDPDHTGNGCLSEVDLPSEGRMVHLKGYGMIKVFKFVSQNGDISYFANNIVASKNVKPD